MKFCQFFFLRDFLALGDKISEMGQVKSARKVYFFSLKIAKMQNNAKFGQKITILTFWKISLEILLGQKWLLGLFFSVKTFFVFFYVLSTVLLLFYGGTRVGYSYP